LYKPGERIERTDISDGIWEAHVTNLYMRFPGIDFVQQVGSVEEMLKEAEAGVRAEYGGFLIQEIEALWLQAKREAGLFYDPDGKTHAYYIHQVITKTPHTSSELLARMKADISEALVRTTVKVTTLLEATSAHTEWWFYYTGGRYGDHVKALPGISEEEVRTFLVSKGITNVLQLVNKYVDQEAEGGDTQLGHWVD
ncbi:hypothetical protein KAZ57_00955, partial [Patescibacteria group bacterium]|nr:hypothetical protein [Patescibacteria group bacterium]